MALFNPLSLLSWVGALEASLGSFILHVTEIGAYKGLITRTDQALTQIESAATAAPVPNDYQERVAALRSKLEASGAYRLVRNSQDSWIGRTVAQ